jgi:hypothetical protein
MRTALESSSLFEVSRLPNDAGERVNPEPHAEPRIEELRARLASLAAECGCTMGGIFLAIALVAALLHFLIRGGLGLQSGLAAGGLIFLASITGKLVGLGAARIRMVRLRRMLTARLTAAEDSHVHVH